MYNTIQIKRRLQGSSNTGVPKLSSGELAYNEKTDELYYGGEFQTLTIAGSGAYVKRDTDQTIAGKKTFSDLTTLSSTTFSPNSTIDAGSNKIINIASPTSNNDATNKTYVDTVSSQLQSAINSLNTSSSASTDALSAAVDANFVEKVETDAVTLNGGLTVTNGLTADTIKTSGAAVIGTKLTVNGDLEVLGTTTTLDTTTTVTSAFSVTNHNTQTAMTVTQTGSQNVAEFYDDANIALAIVDGGKVGIGTKTPNEALTVVGNISATGNTNAVNGTLTGTLNVTGASTLGSTLAVTGASTFASTVSAQGALTVDGASTLQGAATINNTLHATGNTTLDSNLTVGSAVSAHGNLTVDGLTTLQGDTLINGPTTINNTLSVGSNATVSGNLQVVGNLEVLGETTTLETTTTVTSAFSITNHNTQTAMTVTQTGSQNIAEFYDDANIALAVVDGGKVGIGTKTPNEVLTVVGNISATGNTNAVNGTLTGTLNVTGASTLSSTLAVSGIASFATDIQGVGTNKIKDFIIDGGTF